jgi:hypothetical protein
MSQPSPHLQNFGGFGAAYFNLTISTEARYDVAGLSRSTDLSLNGSQRLSKELNASLHQWLLLRF